MDVAVDGGQPDAETAGQTLVGVAVAQVRQYQQGLAAGGEPAPVRTDRGTVTADEACDEVQVRLDKVIVAGQNSMRSPWCDL